MGYRFSLQAFILASCLFAAWMGVLLRADPVWKPSHAEHLIPLAQIWKTFGTAAQQRVLSPDGTRRLDASNREWVVEDWCGAAVYDAYHGTRLFNLSDSDCTACFLSDDRIAVMEEDSKASTFTVTYYERTRPEWWWGYFYRAEVCAALALTGLAFAFHFVRTYLEKNKGANRGEPVRAL